MCKLRARGGNGCPGLDGSTMMNDPLHLDESVEWVGHWWLPDDPEKKVPGILRYDGKGGIALLLIGGFEDRVMSQSASGIVSYHFENKKWHVIRGMAEHREITLFDCALKSSRRTLDIEPQGPYKQNIEARMALFGVHVESAEVPAFSVAEMSIEDLTCWAAMSTMECTYGASENELDGTVSISIKPVASQSVEIDDVEFCLVNQHTLPFFEYSKGQTVGRVCDTVWMRIKSKSPISLNYALDKVKLVQDLISFATDRASGVIWLRLELSQGGCELPNGKRLPRGVDVLYSPLAFGCHDAKAVDLHRVFFTCDSLPFEQILPRWSEKYEQLRSAINMVGSLRYAPSSFIENNLLTAVGAAEVLHRKLDIDTKPIPEVEFEKLRDAIFEIVPEIYKQRVDIHNGPSLRERLLALAERLDPEVAGLFVPDANRWATRTARARNDLAHQGKTPKHSLEELVAVVEVTKAVVVLSLVNEIGLPIEQQLRIVRDHPRLQGVRSWAEKYLIPDAKQQTADQKG